MIRYGDGDGCDDDDSGGGDVGGYGSCDEEDDGTDDEDDDEDLGFYLLALLVDCDLTLYDLTRRPFFVALLSGSC